MARRQTNHIHGWRGRPRRTLRGDLHGLRRAVPAALRSRAGKAAALGLVAGLGLGYAGREVGPTLRVTGPAPDAQVGPAELGALTITAHSSNAQLLRGATLTVDGGDITDEARTADGDLVYHAGDLPDGTHTVRLTLDQQFLPWPEQRSWTFTIDRVPPRIRPTSGQDGNHRGAPVVITGTVSEPVRLWADGAPVPVAGDRFTLRLPEPPAGPIRLRAIDRAGNATVLPVWVGVLPREPPRPVRAVHVSAIAWASAAVRRTVYRQLAIGTLTAVELDLKDERGVVGYDSAVPLARRIGAVRPEYRLASAVRDIHAHGGQVIGRLVVFKDPLLTSWAWRTGHRAMVVQTPSGAPYSGSASGFTNLANDAVRRYNIAIAVEAARAGVDEVLYDYVRRPDGPIAGMRFPGMRGTPSDQVIRFLEASQAALRPTKTLLGASLFGIAAGWRGAPEIAQDVPRMARHLDVVAPMLYPAGWGRGEYGVADPERRPGLIVERSLRAFQRQVAGTGARLVPWLQDYTLGVPYGVAQVRAQIAAAARLGIHEFQLWNPFVDYHFDALDRLPAPPGGAPAAP